MRDSNDRYFYEKSNIEIVSVALIFIGHLSIPNDRQLSYWMGDTVISFFR